MKLAHPLCIDTNYHLRTTSMRSIGNSSGILEQRSVSDLERRGNPILLSSGHLLVGYVHRQGVRNGINVNNIPVLNQSNGSSNLGLRNDMTNDKAMRATNFSVVLKSVTYPPLNRPSVKQATSYPRPAPMIKLVGLSISGIPTN